MNKKDLLKNHGNTKVKDLAGILHNYTENDTLEEHQELEDTIRKWESYSLEKSFNYLEDLLYF